MRAVGLSLLAIGLVLALTGAGLLWFQGVQARRANLVAAPPGDGAFREELVVSAGDLLTSRHGQVDCVAYRTRVIMHSEWPDESSDEIVFQEERGPAELFLSTSTGSVVRLPLALWREPDLFVSETSSEAPVWLSPAPERRAPKAAFRVEEACLKPGQSVFVAASLSTDGRLQADPDLNMLVLYPGNREECVAYYRQASVFQGRAGQAFVGLGSGLVLISGLMILKTRGGKR